MLPLQTLAAALRRTAFFSAVLATLTARAEASKGAVVVFPFAYVGNAHAQGWAPLEEDVAHATAAALAPAGYAVLSREEQLRILREKKSAAPLTPAERSALTEAQKDNLALEAAKENLWKGKSPEAVLAACSARKNAADCAQILGADRYIRGVVGDVEGEVFVFVQAFRASDRKELLTAALAGHTAEELRASFKAQAPALFARLLAPASGPPKTSTGKWHRLRVAEPGAAKLAECDKSMFKTYLRRGSLRTAALGEVAAPTAALARAAGDDNAAEEELETCAKAYGPAYRYVPAVRKGAPVTRGALGLMPVLSPEQCADVHARVGELHDLAKEQVAGAKADPRAAAATGLWAGMFNGLLSYCP